MFPYLRPVVWHRPASQIPIVPIVAYPYVPVVALFFLPHALYIDEPPGFEPGRYISTTLKVSWWNEPVSMSLLVGIPFTHHLLYNSFE